MTLRTRASAILALAATLAFGSGAARADGYFRADDNFLVFNTIALHLQNAEGRNTVTPGIGWEFSPSGKIGFHGGTLSDSFGYQAYYGGLNYATSRMLAGRLRFIVGATVLHKQFRIDGGPETKIVPLPAAEFRLARRAVINISGSPEIDYADHHNNAVVFLQLKLNLL